MTTLSSEKEYEGYGPNSGVLVISWSSYQVLYTDEGIRLLFPQMKVGKPCYQLLGYTQPCPGCPVERLIKGYRPGGLTHSSGICGGHKVMAVRMETETGVYALVLRKSEGSRDKRDRQQMERQMAYLIRLCCDSITEVNLDTGEYSMFACEGAQDIPANTCGNYEDLLQNMCGQIVCEAEPQFAALRRGNMRDRLDHPERGLEYTVQVLRKLEDRQTRLELQVFLMWDQDDPIATILATDVTERYFIAQDSRGQHPNDHWMNDERSRLLLQQMQAMVFEYYPETQEYILSPQIRETLAGNYDGRSLPHILLEDHVIFAEDCSLFESFFNDSIAYGGNDSVVLRFRNREDVFRWYKLSLSTLAGSRNGVTRVIGSICDVDEETRLRESLRYRAEFDLITGIHNKTTFFQKTEQMLWNAPGLLHSIIRFDIDRFKMVNDLFGISAGDTLLHFIGESIQQRMRSGETYARLGDDVFGMCVTRTGKEVELLLEEIDRDLSNYPLAFKLVPSAGVYRVEHYAGEPINVLCDRAGLAQKLVKGNYARRIAFYEPQLGQKLFREQEIISTMHRAIDEHQFEIYLQPQYDIQNNVVFGAEALVRWRHPEKGLIPPADFIPLFEKNGFIIALDEYVWDTVCKMLSDWIQKGYRPMPISVNVSRMHFFDPKFCEKVTQLLERYQIRPHLVELELTESAYVENPYFLGEVMEKLQAQGFTFLMDDFGSGYSSLNMLRTIAVDVLKIDLGFLQECQAGTAGRIILESTLDMARRLRLPVIAEGVETEEQALFLLGAGCTLAQGYYYSKPLPVDEFERIHFEEKDFLSNHYKQVVKTV